MTDLNQQEKINSEEIDLFAIALLLWSKKWIILFLTFFVSILTALHQLYVVTPVFRSDCLILPTSSTTNQMPKLGGLASLVGINAPKKSNTIALILKSRSFWEKLVKKEKLDKRWKCSFRAAVNTARGKLKLTPSSENTTITLEWDSSDPAFALQMLETVLKYAAIEITKYDTDKKKSHLLFLESRSKEALTELKRSEMKLRNFQEKNNGIAVEKQAEALIAQLNVLRAEKTEKEMKLNLLKNKLSNADEKIISLNISLKELDRRIKKIIGNVRPNKDEHNIERSLMDIPKIGMEYASLYRQVRLNQKIYGLLVEQYEMSKVEARKDADGFEVIDAPILPERRISPKRTKAVITASMTTFIASIVLILITNYFFNLIKAINKKRIHHSTT